jgi:hypothetical protein
MQLLPLWCTEWSLDVEIPTCIHIITHFSIGSSQIICEYSIA